MAANSGRAARDPVLWVLVAMVGLGLFMLVPTSRRGWQDWRREGAVREAVELHRASAAAALGADDYVRAELALRSARELDPTSPELQRESQRAWVVAAAHYPETIADGDVEALGYALDQIGKELGTRDAAASLVAAGHLALRKEGVERARELYEQAITTQPDYAPAHFHLGNLRRLLGDLVDAVKAFEAALAAAPEYLEAANSLGTAYVELGREREGMDMLERAIGMRDNAMSRISLAGALARLDRIPEALEHARRAVRLAPRSPVVYGKAGELLLDGGQFEEAEKLLRRSLELRDDPATAFVLGRVYQAQRRFDRAIDMFAGVSRRVGDNLEVAYQLGVSFRALGRESDSARAFGRYLEQAGQLPRERERAAQMRAMLEAPARDAGGERPPRH